MTTRERIKAISRKCGQGDLPPSVAADIQVQLNDPMRLCVDEIRDREMAFNVVLNDLMEQNDWTAARATIKAKTTPEYLAYREAKDTLHVVEQLLISLRAMIRVATEELRATK